jgi:hypothetical protein
MTSLRITIVIGMLLLAAPAAFAHKPSDSYLTLRTSERQVDARWDVALRDLDAALGLDADGDALIRWGELRAQRDRIEAYVLPELRIATGGEACRVEPRALLVERHTDGAYAVLRFAALCPGSIETLDLDYGLFAARDPQHRGLVRVEAAGRTHATVLGGAKRREHLALDDRSPLRGLLAFVRQGVVHIAIGFDHILFLLSLLLPVVLTRGASTWRAASSVAPVASSVLRLVTAFTLAHSLTLSLAVLGWLQLPARWVESAIAASVVIAALDNLVPLLGARRWIGTFGFGLVHGLGFAGVLAELGLGGAPLVPALLGFNLGVELGQLALVAVFLPFAWALRDTWAYRNLAVRLGSAAIAGLGVVWLLERSLEMQILPVVSGG